MTFNKHKFFTVICWLGVLVGLLLIFNKPIASHAIHHHQTQAISQVNPKTIKKAKRKKGDFNYNHVKQMTSTRAARASLAKPPYAIGLMSIPALNMHLPVLKGIGGNNLACGGGTMRPGEVMGKGNYALAGHYMTNQGILFSPLENAQAGQIAYITNLKKIYVYKFYERIKVNPHAMWIVSNTKRPIVTFMTCADGGANRWVIRGNLIKTEKANKKNLAVFNG